MKKVREVLVFVIVVAIGLMLGLTVDKINKQETKQAEKKAEILVITIPEKSTTGVITLYYNDGSIGYQYQGEIDIKNDGTDGEDIDIEVNLPIGPEN